MLFMTQVAEEVRGLLPEARRAHVDEIIGHTELLQQAARRPRMPATWICRRCCGSQTPAMPAQCGRAQPAPAHLRRSARRPDRGRVGRTVPC